MKNQITTLVLCLSVALYHAVPLEVEWARQMNGTDFNMTDGNWSMFRQEYNLTDFFNSTMGNWTRQDLNDTLGFTGNWTIDMGSMGNWTDDLGTFGNWTDGTWLPTNGTY